MTTPAPAPAHGDLYGDLAPRGRQLVTYAVLGCAFLGMLDGTVVGTALPEIVRQTGGSDSWYVWLVTAYLLTSSVSVPLYGRFSDLYGRRRLLLGGLGLFLAGSLACGAAGSMEFLIASRAVQGLGAGALLTLGMALVRDLHPPGRPTGLIRVQTLLASMMIAGMVGGPLVGGLLTDQASWRWAFWINLPLGLAAAAVLALVLPERRPAGIAPGRLDTAGIALLTAGLSLVLVGLSLRGGSGGGGPAAWSDPRVAGPLLGGVALLAVLVPVERRAATPVLPLGLLRHRSYAALLTAGFFFQAAAIPIGVFLPLYFQHLRGHSATVSGLLLLPLLIGMVVGNRLTAVAVLSNGRPKPALLAGAGLLTVGTAAFLALDSSTPLALTSLWLLLAGLGTGPAMGGITIATQNCVPYTDMGTATAGSALAKQIGGSFGLACAQSSMGHHASSATAITAGAVGGTVAWIGGIGGLLALAAVLVMREVVVRAPGGGGPSGPSRADSAVSGPEAGESAARRV